MKSTFFTLAALFSTALAVPTTKRSEHDVKIFLNNNTGDGKTVDVVVPSGGYENSIVALVGPDGLGEDGRVKVSFALVQPIEGKNVRCYVKWTTDIVTRDDGAGLRVYETVEVTPGSGRLFPTTATDESPSQDITEGTIACFVSGERITL